MSDFKDSLFNKYLYYALIFTLSLVSLFILPMIGSELGFSFLFPNTAAGWIIFCVTNLSSAGFNMLIFHFFIKQGKMNIHNHPDYLAANKLLLEADLRKQEIPLSPKQWHKKQYCTKGITLFITTILGTFSLGQALLTFNLVKFLSQFMVLLFGTVFGLMEMKSTEEFWIVEYPEYARYTVAQQKAEKEKELPQNNETSEVNK